MIVAVGVVPATEVQGVVSLCAGTIDHLGYTNIHLTGNFFHAFHAIVNTIIPYKPCYTPLIVQSSRCAPYCDKVTLPRTTLQIIHVFLLLSCPGMPGHGKVTKINVLFATLYKMEDS